MTDREPQPVQLPDLQQIAYNELLRTAHRNAKRALAVARKRRHHAEQAHLHATLDQLRAERAFADLQAKVELERSISHHATQETP